MNKQEEINESNVLNINEIDKVSK